jgi:gluconate kinase
MNDFCGWAPIWIYWQGSDPMVDWGYLGKRRFTRPFFAQTIEQCVRHPADLLFRHQTPLAQLETIARSQPGLPPTGFIFHMSRCGSTLISQMLAATTENIVLSEAGPIDNILRAQTGGVAISEDQRVQWLRWVVGVLAWRREEREKNVFIKFDCWHTLFLPLIQRAFPGVPWIFVYRDPLEVMVSHQRRRGGQMIPGVLEPELFGWELPGAKPTALNEYGARALAKICEAALAGLSQENGKLGKLVNYRQLPDSIWPGLMEHWGVRFSAAETARMMAAAELNAKNPVLRFEPDSEAKNAEATPEIRALTREWLEGTHQKLEAERRRRGFN